MAKSDLRLLWSQPGRGYKGGGYVLTQNRIRFAVLRLSVLLSIRRLLGICRRPAWRGGSAAFGVALLAACGGGSSAPVSVNPLPNYPTPIASPDLYDKQERCGRASRDWFRQFYGDGSSRDSDFVGETDYENHFNAALNGCFAVVTARGNSRKSDSATRLSLSKTLFDVNESRNLGGYFTFIPSGQLMECTMDGSACTSIPQWEGFAKKFMER